MAAIVSLPRTNAKKAPARTVEFIPDRPGTGILVLQVGARPAGYRVTETKVGPDQSGRGFRLVKVFGGTDSEAEEYECFVPKDLAEVPICGCKGFLYHSRCKHLDGLRSVVESGQFDGLEVQAPAPADPCDYCGGAGRVFDEFSSPESPDTCPVCGGIGTLAARQVRESAMAG